MNRLTKPRTQMFAGRRGRVAARFIVGALPERRKSASKVAA
jgi:hypothetical protein